jgi:transposase
MLVVLPRLGSGAFRPARARSAARGRVGRVVGVPQRSKGDRVSRGRTTDIDARRSGAETGGWTSPTNSGQGSSRFCRLPVREHKRGHPWRPNHDVLNGVLWVLRTGAPWKDIAGRIAVVAASEVGSLRFARKPPKRRAIFTRGSVRAKTDTARKFEACRFLHALGKPDNCAGVSDREK